MSLSEQEMRALREIEQSLFADDPKFGSSVVTDSGVGSAPKSGQLTMRSLAPVSYTHLTLPTILRV